MTLLPPASADTVGHLVSDCTCIVQPDMSLKTTSQSASAHLLAHIKAHLIIILLAGKNTPGLEYNYKARTVVIVDLETRGAHSIVGELSKSLSCLVGR